MKIENASVNRAGELLRTHKLVILLEIVIVLLPFCLGLVFMDSTGIDRISIGGNLVILGGPMVYLGVIITLLFLFEGTVDRDRALEPPPL